MLLLVLIRLPLFVLSFVLVTTVATTAITVFYAVSLLRTRSLRRATYLMIRQSIIASWYYIMTLSSQKKPMK